MRMKRRYRRWSDAEVLSWALLYIETGCTLMELEATLGIPHSTLSWAFINRLPMIDGQIAEEVREWIDIHTSIHRREEQHG